MKTRKTIEVTVHPDVANRMIQSNIPGITFMAIRTDRVTTKCRISYTEEKDLFLFGLSLSNPDVTRHIDVRLILN